MSTNVTARNCTPAVDCPDCVYRRSRHDSLPVSRHHGSRGPRNTEEQTPRVHRTVQGCACPPCHVTPQICNILSLPFSLVSSLPHVLCLRVWCHREWIVVDGMGVLFEACNRHGVIDAAKMRICHPHTSTPLATRLGASYIRVRHYNGLSLYTKLITPYRNQSWAITRVEQSRCEVVWLAKNYYIYIGSSFKCTSTTTPPCISPPEHLSLIDDVTYTFTVLQTHLFSLLYKKKKKWCLVKYHTAGIKTSQYRLLVAFRHLKVQSCAQMLI